MGFLGILQSHMATETIGSLDYNEIVFPKLGIDLHLDSTAFEIGGLSIQWYGILITLGLVLALIYAFTQVKQYGLHPDRFLDTVIGGIIGGIVGARTYYVLLNWDNYAGDWKSIFNLREGGLAIYGGIIGGLLVGCLVAKLRKVRILPLLDIAGIGFLLGQGIGRWGNFFNQEVFGVNTDLPWGMYSEATQAYLLSVQGELAARGVTVDPSRPVHPTFFYEFVWCIAGFLVLWALMKKRRFHGQIFLEYLVWYGAGRFWIEGIRSDTLMGAGTMPVSQQVALACVAGGLALLAAGFYRARGKALTVPLAVDAANLKRMKTADGPTAVHPAELPAGASHAEFAAATRKMNDALAGILAASPNGEETPQAPRAPETPDEQEGKPGE